MEISNHLNKAFRILRRNYSCPGADGLSYKTIKSDFSQHRNLLEFSLKNKTFRFTEPRKCLVKTGVITPKVRDVFVYNIYDRWIQETIRIELNNHLQNFIHPHVYSYIRGKNRRQAFEYILNCNPKFILILDLKNFAGSIRVPKLFSMLEQVNIPSDLLDIIHDSIKHSEKGLPKGNSITSVLSNFYLTPIDKMFSQNYCRFSDDLIFALENENQVNEIITKVKPMFDELELELNEEKIKCIANTRALQIIDEYPWII
jgi:retron-type reverse transcriptase